MTIQVAKIIAIQMIIAPADLFSVVSSNTAHWLSWIISHVIYNGKTVVGFAIMLLY